MSTLKRLPLVVVAAYLIGAATALPDTDAEQAILALFGNGQPVAALQRSQACVDAAPGDPRPVPLLYESIVRSVEKGLGKEARRVLEEWSRQKPGSEWPILALAFLAAETDEAEAAVQELAEALEANPVNPDCYFVYAYAIWRSGKPDEAADYVQQALQIEPGHIPSVALCARMALEGGDLVQARIRISMLKTLAPGSPILERVEAEYRAFSDEPVHGIAGLVKDSASGQILPGARVVLRSQTSSRGLSFRHRPETFTDNEGKFEFRELPPGTYLITASRADMVTPKAQYVRVGYEGNAEPVEVLLEPGASIVGSAVDSETKMGIVNFPVTITIPGVGVETVVTDAAGRFQIAGLMPGKYYLRAAAEGYVMAAGQTLVNLEEAGKPVEVILEATRAATVRGRVVDADGRPVAEAEVTAAWEHRPRAVPAETHDRVRAVRRAQAIPAIEADEEGRFELANISPGFAYVVVANHDDIGGILGPRMNLEPGQIIEELVLTIPQAERVEGIVMGSDGKPVPNADVSFYSDFSHQNLLLSSDILRRRTSCDENGRFTVLGLAECRFSVRCNADGYLLLDSRSHRRADGKNAPVQVKQGAKEPVNMTAQEADALTGRIVYAGKTLQVLGEGPQKAPLVITLDKAAELSGTIVDSDGTPFGGLRVYAWTRSKRFRDYGAVDDMGKFKLFVPPGETCRLRAYMPGRASLDLGEAKPEDSPLKFVIPKGPEVRGAVRDAVTDEPVRQFTIGSVIRANLALLGTGTAYELAPVDFKNPKGEFVYRGPERPNVTLYVKADGYAPATLRNVPTRSMQEQIVKLRKAYEIQGRVVDDDGKPIANAQIHLNQLLDSETLRKGLALHRPAVTDKNGRFELDGIRGGTTTLYVTHDDYATDCVTTVIGRSADDPLTVEISRGVNLRLSYSDERGRSIQDATVYLSRRAAAGKGEMRLALKTDRRGRIARSDLAPGKWALTLVDTSNRRQTASYTLQLGAKRSVRLDLGGKETVTIKGKVEWPERPRRSVRINLYQKAPVPGVDTASMHTTAEADGSFVFRRVPKADSTISVSASGYRSESVRWTPDQDPAAITLKLEDPRRPKRSSTKSTPKPKTADPKAVPAPAKPDDPKAKKPKNKPKAKPKKPKKAKAKPKAEPEPEPKR